MPRARASGLVLAALLAGCAPRNGVPLEMRTWDRPFAPHHVAGNIYFVGKANLGIFLITTPAGHILLDSGFAPSVPELAASIAKLGFQLKDVKVLLASHAHVDHVQGHAAVRAASGAQVVASAADARFITSGGQGDPTFDDRYRWDPCPVDRVIADGETVTLGGTTLTAHLTPGHTPGAVTWTTTVEQDGRRLAVVFFPSANILPGTKLVNNPRYPTIAADFERSFAVWRSLPCDVFLGAHGAFYDLERKYDRLKAGDTRAFIDPDGYRKLVAGSEKTFRALLESQR